MQEDSCYLLSEFLQLAHVPGIGAGEFAPAAGIQHAGEDDVEAAA